MTRLSAASKPHIYPTHDAVTPSIQEEGAEHIFSISLQSFFSLSPEFFFLSLSLQSFFFSLSGVFFSLSLKFFLSLSGRSDKDNKQKKDGWGSKTSKSYFAWSSRRW